jgi:hypothetical protein
MSRPLIRAMVLGLGQRSLLESGRAHDHLQEWKN